MCTKTLAAAVVFSFATLTGAHAQQGTFFEIPPGFFSAMRGGPEAGSYLGVYLAEVGPETVQQLGLPEEYGAHVSEVMDDSPASRADLKADDVVVGWNGTRVESVQQLKRMVTETPPGRTVELSIIREGDARTIDAEIGERGGMETPQTMPTPNLPWQHPDIDDWTPPPMPGRPAGGSKAKLGVLLQGLTDQLGAYFGLKDRSGVLVVEVLKGTIAQEAGLQAGDVIVEIDGVEVESPAEVQRTVAELSGDARLTILRDREEQVIDASFPAQEDEDVRVRVIPDDEDEEEEDAPRFPGSAM